MKFEVQPLSRLPDALRVTSASFVDKRGGFFESYREADFAAAGIAIPPFVQGNVSYSHIGAARGLHYQIKQPQGKFLRTVNGATYNLLVDMRLGSPTFGERASTGLYTPDTALWVPPGFANGFVAAKPNTVVVYECTTYHVADSERALDLLDPVLEFNKLLSSFGLDKLNRSPKDQTAPLLRDAEPVPEAEWRM